ncbi:DHH family phosphoesterase [Motiliproteus sp. SC1-56]|uniref:DHH family phosphoesterase n=1 Tax=Motiliproteus sp. SC1-56 TaxID=2799565 RepID=UPI001A8FC96B|nr:DHH family phosphoesterase [Motiliproteus sp. SC1-56]
MTQYDVFNGDADGLCALIQMRLAEPMEDAVPVTGVKRDISLLKRVEAVSGDRVLVLDISLDKNRAPLEGMLRRGVSVTYIDHHFAGELPTEGGLDALIDPDPHTCTSLLVNQRLEGQFAHWAVVGAFGDNMNRPATELAAQVGLSEAETATLKELGVCLNYNGYGTSLEDLHFDPAFLYEKLHHYGTPFAFIEGEPEIYRQLLDGYREDMARAGAVAARLAEPDIAVFELPDEVWACRISGVFGNRLANAHPERAHAVLTHNRDGGYTVSVRAPAVRKEKADELCRQFPTGGGRQGAAGINHLPPEALDGFIAAFRETYRTA